MIDRTIVIGDVHGCAVELDELLSTLALTSNDRLVFLGDLMDRGPDPVACVRRVRGLGAEAVRSNHDEKHARWRKHHRTHLETGKKNPIRFTPMQTTENLSLSDDDIAWLSSLPLSIELGNGWHAIHAGLEPCKSFDEQKDCDSLMRTRFINDDGTAYTAKDHDAPDPLDKWFWSQRWRGPESIVYGHHIHRFLGPRIDTHAAIPNGPVVATCVGLDTGCYAGGRLSAMILMPDGRYSFEHANARSVYLPLSDKYGKNRPDPLTLAKEAS